jgi:hypothetical protein
MFVYFPELFTPGTILLHLITLDGLVGLDWLSFSLSNRPTVQTRVDTQHHQTWHI